MNEAMLIRDFLDVLAFKEVSGGIFEPQFVQPLPRGAPEVFLRKSFKLAR